MGAFIVIVGLLLMVVVHEAAHFVAAKRFGMKATEAFFGFGPRLWSTRRGETEYGVRAIPLGGFVRIVGMNPFEEVAPSDEGRTYREAHFWKKTVVVLAGVASHFVVAFVILYVVVLGYGVARDTNEVEVIYPLIARSSGTDDEERLVLRSGDEVVSVDGAALDKWALSSLTPAATTQVGVLRDGEYVSLETTDRVEPSPAFLSDIAVGDRLVSFDGIAVESWDDFRRFARRRPNQTVTIAVERDGSVVSITTTLAAYKKGGYFGVSPTRTTETVNPLTALSEAMADLGSAASASTYSLWALVVNLDDIGSAVFGDDAVAVDEVRPVSAIGLFGVAREGSIEFALGLIAFVNVFVGVLNVVPLYPLDGGHFSVALYERIKGTQADVRRLLPLAAAVFLFLAVIGLLGIYLDIVDPIHLPE